MNLENKKCVPCKGGVAALNPKQVEEYLSNSVGWAVNARGEIEKNFKFKNFVKSLEFINKVGEVAESENHHPDIEFGWGYCKIRLMTHSIKGLHENDFIVAAKIDGISNA